MIERFRGRDLDEKEQAVLGHVERVGWSITSVSEQDGVPGWSFTIGLFENFDHPEVAIFGMKAQSCQSILNWIGENVRKGNHFTSGLEHDWVLDGYKCWSREVQKVWYRDLVGWAIWFYGGTDFPVVQCLWPAKDGTYPWQEESGFFVPQPLICFPLEYCTTLKTGNWRQRSGHLPPILISVSSFAAALSRRMRRLCASYMNAAVIGSSSDQLLIPTKTAVSSVASIVSLRRTPAFGGWPAFCQVGKRPGKPPAMNGPSAST
jgi:hypothetical protein